MLFFLAVATRGAAATEDNVLARHMRNLQKIPRIPLSSLHKVSQHRHLFNLADWSDAGMEMDCDFADFDVNNPSVEKVTCQMVIGDEEYEMLEDCKENGDGVIITCEICTLSLDNNDFKFCYGKWGCGWSALFGWFIF